MSCQREIFTSSGPFQLSSIDWANASHRRTVAASLVQGAYNLEHDRQQNIHRGGPQAQAPPWWEFFGFQLNEVLVDDDDGSYFGAVYEYRHCNNNDPYYYNYQYSHQNPPRHVVAFRGTVTKPDSRKQDLKLDLQFIRNNLHKSRRFHRALQVVQNSVITSGAGKVWLAGHSLGSAIALLVGRNMVSRGNFHLETYLFNPPFDSPPFERIKHEKIKDGIRIASSFITAGVAAAVHHRHQHQAKTTHDKEEDDFSKLCGWIPYLFVNPSDPICCEYMGYFAHRDKMVKIGAGKIGQLATQNSIVSVVSGAIGKENNEAIHLIPSAYLTINTSNTHQDMRQAHGIQQWWRPDIQCDYKLYQYNK